MVNLSGVPAERNSSLHDGGSHPRLIGAGAGIAVNIPFGVTPLSQSVYHLHMLSFYVSLAICAVVFISLTILLIKFRKSANHKPAKVKPHRLLEISWVIVPFILLIIMGVPATIILIHADHEENADLNIKITGYQWKWEYEYLDEGIRFFSVLSTPFSQLHGNENKNKWYLREVDHPLVLPIHKKIRFLVTSNDVIHSWWVPELGVKRDAIPGFIYESKAWIKKPGIYRGQCAELCGINHGFMPIVVEAKTQADYDKWVQQQKSQFNAPDNTISEGKKLYLRNCSACHLPDGSGRPPYVPALQGGKGTIGPIKFHIEIVLKGIPKTAMPAFSEQLSSEQIAAVINYERNSWGNNDKIKYGSQAGGIVTPEEIEQVRSEGGS